MTTPTSKNTTFLIDDHVLSSPNADPLSSLPTFSDVYESTPPQAVWSLRGAINPHPHIPFIPATIRWDEPLLQRFAFDLNSFPIERSQNRFCLSETLSLKWSNFEYALRLVVQHLFTECRGALFPLEFAYLPLPSTYGYLRSHAREIHARKCALNARDAFVGLMAMCSLAIAFWDIPQSDNPPWVRVLLEKAGIHPEWVDQLRRSSIGDLSGRVPRVGTVVNVSECKWTHLIPMMVRANVPIWILWSTIQHPLKASPIPRLAPYFPSRDQVAAALQVQAQKAQAQLTPSIHPTTTFDDFDDQNTPPPRRFPEPYPYSGQRYAETWQDFFTRQAARHAKMAAKETDKEKQARLQRERDNQSYCMPGKKGARVFRWLEVDGFLIRTAVVRGEVEDVWEDTPDQHKRYNAFDREWDICSEFAPDVQDCIDDADKYHEWQDNESEPITMLEDGEVIAPVSCKFTEMSPIAQQPISWWRQDLFLVYDEGDNHSADTAPKFSSSLDLILYNRFGFDWEPTEACDDEPEPLADVWHKNGALLIQDSTSRVDRVYKSPIIKFFSRLAHESLDELSDMPWDLSSTRLTPLRGMIGHYVNVVKRRAGEKTMYTILPTLQDAGNDEWELTVDNPATALQCVRWASSSNITHIVRLLLENGIPFNTFLLRSLSPPPLSSHPLSPFAFVGLGVRPPGYQPDNADYAAYQEVLSDFLRLPHARAALLKGGIVWHLVMEYLSPKTVLTGPSDNASQMYCLLDSQEYCDDDLSSDELELICGVYKVYTGNLIFLPLL